RIAHHQGPGQVASVREHQRQSGSVSSYFEDRLTDGYGARRNDGGQANSFESGYLLPSASLIIDEVSRQVRIVPRAAGVVTYLHRHTHDPLTLLHQVSRYGSGPQHGNADFPE